MKARMQYCEYCGEEQGVFEHHRRLDGPVVCGKSECQREGRADERAERADRAVEDGFQRY